MKYTIRGKRKVLAHPDPIQIIWDNGKIDTDKWTWRALHTVDGDHIGQKLGYILSECNGIGNHYEHEDCLHHIIDDLMEEGYSIEIQLDDGTIVHSWDDIPEEEGGDLVVNGMGCEEYQRYVQEQEQAQHRKTA